MDDDGPEDEEYFSHTGVSTHIDKFVLAALESELRKAVVAKIGEENIQSPVKPIENFYIAADGWHFVYNQYEIACYAIGAVEVVVKRSAAAK